MTAVTMISQPSGVRVPVRTGVRGLVFGLLSWLAAAQSRTAARYHLQTLDDRQLRDVGLTRTELDRALGPTFSMIR